MTPEFPGFWQDTWRRFASNRPALASLWILILIALMAIIGPIVRNELFFFITILVLAGLMVLFEMKSRQPVELPPSGAARRKALD